MTRVVILLTLLPLLLACGEGEGELYVSPSHKMHELKVLKTVEVGVPDTVPYTYSYSELWINKAEVPYYFVYSEDVHALYWMDLDRQRYMGGVKLAYEGPQGIAPVDQFVVHSPDSIFLFCEVNQELVLLDTTGVIARRWLLSEAVEAYNEPDTLSYIGSPNLPTRLFYAAPFKSMVMVPDTPYDFYQGHGFYKRPNRMLFHLEEERFTKVFGDYPPQLKSGPYYANDHDVAHAYNTATQQLVLNFRRSHYLYVYQLPQGQLVAKKPAASLHLPKEFKAGLPRRFDPEPLVKALLTQPAYDAVVYDPYRGGYVRVALPEQAHKNADGRVNESRPFSLLFLNDDLSPVSESQFQAGRYFYAVPSFGPEGLYLRVAVSAVPKEGVVAFDVIEVP